MKRPRMAVETAKQLVNETLAYGPSSHTLFALYENRGWDALGHANWDDFLRAELRFVLDGLNENDRQALAVSLRSDGMSLRGIASVVRWSHTKVQAYTDGKSDEPQEFAGRVTNAMKDARRTMMTLESMAIHPEFQNTKHLIGDDLARELRAIQASLQNVALSNQ